MHHKFATRVNLIRRIMLVSLAGVALCLRAAAAAPVHAQGDPLPAAGDIVAVAGGEAHTCLLTGDGAVLCWGANSYGQLGDGTRTNRTTPVPVIGLTSGVQAIAAGGHHTCALTGAGEVRCWGRNNAGQVGDGTTILRAQPALVTELPNVRQIAAGFAHTCAIGGGGRIFCWGNNSSGQLGDNSTVARSTPVRAGDLSGIQALTAGGAHTCALDAEGGVACWGSNFSGQLGDGTRTNRRSPSLVAALDSITAIGAGGSHTCALTAAGTLRCWGNNFYGQLGDATTTQRLRPVDVKGLPGAVHAFSTGLVHTCVRVDEGRAACFGWNGFGQLGDGTLTNRALPTAVAGLADPTVIAAANGLNSAGHTCAATAGQLLCWGKNSSGQLGDGSQVQRLTPVPVRLPQRPQSYRIEGRVVDGAGAPLAGVIVQTASGATAVTDNAGAYQLRNLKPGIYAITPAKAGYRFIPAQQSGLVVPPALTAATFVGAAIPAEPFALDLPFPYAGTAAEFARLTQNWNNGGRTTAWFDHAYPDYTVDERIWTFNMQIPLPADLTGLRANRCAQEICYDGHNGTDFARDYAAPGGTPALAAAAGTVITVTTGCIPGDVRCASGWGNQVVLAHAGEPVYYTRYAHLASVTVAAGAVVAGGQPLGMMGTTGNSTGVHLHFGLYRDDGDGRWEDRAYDKAVDPFGWQVTAPDPWVAERAGAVSVPLWKYALASQGVVIAVAGEPDPLPVDETTATAAQLADATAPSPDAPSPDAPSPDAAPSQGTWQEIIDARQVVSVAVPPLAFAGRAALALEPAGAPPAPADWRGAGPAFNLRPVEVVGALDGKDVAALIDEATALTGGEALTLTVRYTAADVRHLAVAALRIQRWAAETQSWSTMTSTVDLTAQHVTAPATRFGLYQLQAPLRCPADVTEPDDYDLAAMPIGAGEAPVERLFDSAEDEDWLRIELAAGTPFMVNIQQDGAPGVVWELLSHNGVTPLASGAAMTAAPPFTPPATGVYYLRLRPPAQAMVAGCTATYRVQVTSASASPLYLPIVVQ